jgi:uncharacterized repeat protein (TIGR03917 family)
MIMNSRQPTVGGSIADADTVSLLGKIDSSTVTVGTQPGPSGAGRVVLLRVQSPMLDVLTASFLTADEAHRLAAALSTAAFAAAGRPIVSTSTSTGPGGDGDGTRAQHVVCGQEGITAAELCHALAAVPAHSRLTDFASDVDVVLVFTPPAAEFIPPTTGDPEAFTDDESTGTEIS